MEISERHTISKKIFLMFLSENNTVVVLLPKEPPVYNGHFPFKLIIKMVSMSTQEHRPLIKDSITLWWEEWKHDAIDCVCVSSVSLMIPGALRWFLWFHKQITFLCPRRLSDCIVCVRPIQSPDRAAWSSSHDPATSAGPGSTQRATHHHLRLMWSSLYRRS